VKAKNLVLDRPVVKVEGACRENDPTKCFTGNDLLAVADECIRAPDQQSRRDDVEQPSEMRPQPEVLFSGTGDA